MGLFDLDDYKAKKARADESATPPREFPIALAEVLFDGRTQTLRFQPVLFDGGEVFIGFRTEDSEEEFIVGGGGYQASKGSLDEVPVALHITTNKSFDPANWLARVVRAVENGHFGRLFVEEPSGKQENYLFHFFGSTGAVDTAHYHHYLDGSRGLAHRKASYDPSPRYGYWANPQEATKLLLSLDADEFALHLELQKADPNSVYGLSSRWDDLSFAQKHAMLPPMEQGIERELLPLMRAIVWSDSSFSNGDPLQSARELQKPFWRRPRLWVAPDGAEIGDILALDERFTKRIRTLWPHLHAYFAPLVSYQTDIHPAISHWMRYRGAYIVEWEQPNAHEHLEARLLLRDFLANRGLSLDVLERNL